MILRLHSFCWQLCILFLFFVSCHCLPQSANNLGVEQTNNASSARLSAKDSSIYEDYLTAQWSNPSDVSTIMLLIGGEVIQVC